MRKAKRSYESPGRRRQAQETRRRLAASARALFAERGYSATTIEAIAGEAGVAVQTFYATYGTKRAVLLALLDEVEREAELTVLTRRLREDAGDPRAQLRWVVEFNVRLFGRAVDVLEVLQAAGSADADLAAVWREGERRRREGQAPLVGEWSRSGALRPALAEHEAADVLWAFTGPDSYRLFVRERGWEPERYGAWLAGTLDEILFGR